MSEHDSENVENGEAPGARGGPRRLAVLDHGEPAVRMLAAARHVARDTGTRIVAAVLVAGPMREAWWAREADEAIPLTERRPSTADVVRALQDAGIDTVWIGDWWCLEPLEFVEACEEAGLALIGPGSHVLRRLQDGLAGLADEAGVHIDDGGAAGDHVVEVDTLTDPDGTTWTLDVRDVSVTRDGSLVLAESPAPSLSAETAAQAQDAARRLVSALGHVGAAVVRFTVRDGGLVCLGVDVTPRAEHAAYEEMSGASLIGLPVRIALGERLGSDPAPTDGHIVEARVIADDTSGEVELFTLPVGTGVRVDASLREGDLVVPSRDQVVATITAWGRDRDQALERARGALESTAIVLADGGTNRSDLLAMLRRTDLAESAPTTQWLPALEEEGALAASPDPIALVAAAVEIHDTDLAAVRRAFRASAERGRPEHPEQVGSRVAVSYAGDRHTLRVDRVAKDTYRVRENGGAVSIDVVVDRISRFERRISAGERVARVIAREHEGEIHLEVDGAAHVVSREDGVVVRTRNPALVESLQVAVGDEVLAGDVVATLESMKMVSAVAAPLSGQVTSIAVLPNQQVEGGEPLLRIRPHQDADAPTAGPTSGEVSLATLGSSPRHRADLFSRLEAYLLGYDLDPAAVKANIADYRSVAASTDPTDPTLLAREDHFLDVFADIAALYRPRTEAEEYVGDEEDSLADGSNSQEYLIAFLQWLDADRAGLPERYRSRLASVLARYDVHLGEDGPGDREALEEATLWMFRSFGRVPELAPLVVDMLDRRLQHVPALAPLASAEGRARLQRLVAATEGRQQGVNDVARDVLYHFHGAPVLAKVTSETEAQMFAHLNALGSRPDHPDREQLFEQLVSCPLPMRSLLLRQWLAGADDEATTTGLRQAVLETYIRRFYRIRAFHDITFQVVDGVDLATASYEHEGLDLMLVVAYVPLGEVPRVSRVIGTHLGTHAFQREAVVDLVTWREGARPSIEETAAQAVELLEDCDFGRLLHRLDLTITSLAGRAPERERTQHVTFRQTESGEFVEDTVYRNLHPMLAKRIELWRLENFTVRRLPSPEDVHLFDAVAKENPRDHRLFAVAEVRDLTPVEDEDGISYPQLGRVGLGALAAMRSALAHFPVRERPVANRLTLWVRPTWTVPQSEWQSLAMMYAGIARGLSLQLVVLHVNVPAPTPEDPHATVARIITLEGLGGSGLTVRMGEPGPNAIRALTPYAQKVLTASRFGAPYPYEIVRMLTPAAHDTSPFPPGTWQEMDLDETGERLVPVNREPGRNSAHLVVGLLTNHTATHPEGMTRVAMLSDPTQGLGNLSEPECRRINACLAYALEHRIPVEWYAVSSGALIAMDSGTENMDWIALTLRRLIEYTQAGGEINILITGITVGGQPYWNAEATMLMHTKGILIMTPASQMVLTGKQALDYSGAVSADDNSGIGGYDRIMGPNGQAQYWAPSFPEACRLLLHHYDFTYVVPGQRFPRRHTTEDPVDRDVRTAPHAPTAGSSFTTVGDVFGADTNPERKRPFDMRSVMRSVTDTDCEPLERWKDWQDADTSIVWDATIGGIPVCMIGLESHAVRRKGFVPSYGPPAWTSGTLFPQSSRKTARAINAATGNRPLVVLANLSGFDGSPESMRNWQLEYGAEIGRAVTNFDGPIVFVVVSRYHGGAFVVFSKALSETMEIAAVEGSYASVIGGAPAAATVFAREVKKRTEADPRVKQARAAAAEASGKEAATLRATLARVTEEVRSERLREVADEFDGIHTIERAQRVGSVDLIIPADRLRPYVVEALERGMARFFAQG